MEVVLRSEIADRQYFSEYYPEYTIRIAANPHHHTHPDAALERRLAEDLAYRLLRQYTDGLIGDVGGNAHRHFAAARPSIRCLNPILSPMDSVRDQRNLQVNCVSSCEHKALECDCVDEYCAYLLVHSIYYLSVEEVLKLLHDSTDKILVSVQHRFPHARGLLHDGRYRKSEFGTILAEFGGGAKYVHPNIDWLQNTSYYSNGQLAMAWTVERQSIDCSIIRFAVAEVGHEVVTFMNFYPERQLTWEEEVVDVRDTGLGPGGHGGCTKPIVPIFEDHELLCNFWLFRWQKRVVVCKQVLDHMVRVTMLRDVKSVVPEKIRLHLTATYLKRSMDMNLTSAQVTAMMFDTVKVAENQLLTINQKYTALSASWLGDVPSWYWTHVKLQWWTFGTVGLICFTFRPRWLLAGGIPAFVWYLGRAIWTSCLSVSKHVYDYAKVLSRHSDVVAVDTCQLGQKIEPQQAGSSLKAPYCVQCLPNIGYRLLGVGVLYNGSIPCQPIGTRMCTHNAILAVKNRIMRDVGENLHVWRLVMDRARALHVGFDYDETRPTNFQVWVNRFPDARRNQLLAARDKVKREGHRCVNTGVIAFIKQESYYHKDNYTPRLIQGRHDTFLCITGPAMHAIGNEMKRVWDRMFCVCYTSGMTANELGKWFEAVVHVKGHNARFLVVDQKWFDGSQKEGARIYEQTEYNRYAFVRRKNFWAQCLRHCLKSTAFTRGFILSLDIIFQYMFGRQSGDAHTSVGNSDINAGVINHCLTEAGLYLGDGQDLAQMLVLGDDNLVSLPIGITKDREEQLLEVIQEQGQLLGFTMKATITDKYSAEFCSGRFYPVFDGVNLTCVWGPKIGRILYKFYWKKNEIGDDDKWLSGVVTSRIKDFSFIPVLRIINRFLHGLGYYDTKAVKFDHKPHMTSVVSPCPEMWAFLEHVYGYSQEEWETLEDNLRMQLTPPLPILLTHSQLDHVIDVDVGAPQMRLDA